jgi:hypothetical protein
MGREQNCEDVKVGRFRSGAKESLYRILRYENMTTLENPTLVKTEEINTAANGKRAREDTPPAAPIDTKLGKLRVASASMGTRTRPRYIELEFDRDAAQRDLATVVFPETSLKDFRIDATEKKNTAANTTYMKPRATRSARGPSLARSCRRSPSILSLHVQWIARPRTLSPRASRSSRPSCRHGTRRR